MLKIQNPKSKIQNLKAENRKPRTENLKRILKEMKSVLIAYSGGGDSTFLLKVALDTLGRKDVLAVTGRSETYPESEYREAVRLAKALGARHKTIYTEEFKNPNFRRNPPERCYYCKTELFTKLKEIARQEMLNHVVDGTNYDDRLDYRPGMRAKGEQNVRSPLAEARLTKADIRRLSRAMGLSTWNKPSLACLSSRFPYNKKITRSGLRRIEEAEEFIHSLGISQVRVRMHDSLARIEVEKDEIGRVVRLKDSIANRLSRLGFKYVAVDLRGYRTGSMNIKVP